MRWGRSFSSFYVCGVGSGGGRAGLIFCFYFVFFSVVFWCLDYF